MDTPQDNCFESSQEFLIAEFNYISQTAFQAQEDRARISEFYLIGIGSVLAALFSSQLTGVEKLVVYQWLVALFLAVAILGALTVLQLARLRLAWLESARAMDTIKDCLTARCPPLADCFRWGTHTIPASFKPWSVGFLLALQVSIISGMAVGAAVAFALLSGGQSGTFLEISLAGAASAAIAYLTIFYYLPLRKAQ